jgi:hypothetical protein
MVLYVNVATDNKNLHKDYSVIFKTNRAVIATDMDTDSHPIDSTLSPRLALPHMDVLP